MMRPDSNGLVSVGGSPMGGHAYILNGVDVNKRLYRIKNSWGHRWGINSHGFINIDDFDKILHSGAEACIALETNLTSIPDLNSFVSEDVRV